MRMGNMRNFDTDGGSVLSLMHMHQNVTGSTHLGKRALVDMLKIHMSQLHWKDYILEKLHIWTRIYTIVHDITFHNSIN